MPAYLTLTEFRAITTMPGAYVDEVETLAPGYTDSRLAAQSALIDARLRKRYAVPFLLPAPVAVQEWLARLVTLDVWQRRGYDPSDAQFMLYREQAQDADAALKEAADAETGLYDLPLSSGASAIVKGTPRSYSEHSPYAFTDVQGAAGRADDIRRRGRTS